MSNNFTTKAENALNRSVKIAEEYGHTYIGTEHVLLALAEDETSCASILLKKNKVTVDALRKCVKEYSGIGTKSQLTSKDTTPKCRKLLESAYKIAKKYSSERVGTEHLLFAILDEKDCVASKILTKTEADFVTLKDNVITFLRSSDKGIIFAEPTTEASVPNLTKYGKNISLMAEKGELDPVIGRDRETERVIRILSRRSKNNPCLIGEAGVGKTAIIEGLAIRISEGRVPFGLQGKIIFSLDLTSMVAGAKYRGDFEERIKNIMIEASKNKSVILFIDEIHSIVGAGSAEGAIDAANIMKPELARGDIQLIGATTLAEYRKYIEKDSALERRFQPVLVNEPTVEGTIKILYGLKERYESHHNILIDHSAIDSAARLSQRYIQDRFLPDKAIDVLDEACAMANVVANLDTDKSRIIREKIRQINEDKKNAIVSQDFELAINLKELEKLYNAELNEEIALKGKANDKATVTDKQVRMVIEEISGVNLCSEKDEGKIENTKINDKLLKAVVGQDVAVNSLSCAVIRSLAGINSPTRPRGIFLFLGESGVGKTKLAEALSKELFQSDDSLIRLDMSEYAESYSISKLIGSAPGYVGYDDTSSVLERIRKHPYSVILLDEIEKAHQDVLSLFLQIFDTGILTDALGRKINFRNSYIIMTSNLGIHKNSSSKNVGFMQSSDNNDARNSLRGYFKDEFINRIDEIIQFNRLDLTALKEIAKIKVSDLSERLLAIGISLKCDESVYDTLAKSATKEGLGARELDRMIVKHIENTIAELMVHGEISCGDSVIIHSEKDVIKCEKQYLALK